MWQIEHNGAWRWEIGHDTVGDYLSLSGPTHADNGWLRRLKPNESFASVPVAFAVAGSFAGVVANMTSYRRASRLLHSDQERAPVIFNDYMNTLNGDPTTEKLLPLVDAAATVGAEIFCIDAGWYDNDGDWWDSVGEWHPSTIRFPRGLVEVIDRIRALGMTPGLWLEPEVVGVRSPLVAELPSDAFFSLAGERLVEHHRHHLDLRHPAARAHLDGVIDRLITEFGIGYFKFDYNINPGMGTDEHADSAGDGLLGHNRAHLDWLESVLGRHPDLILENCASGAMRSDWAMMSRLQLQSTSDQQEPLLYPPIAASAPLTVLPEQAANWAYPQPSMTDEEIAFTLVTGLAGRFFLSGHLDQMTPEQIELVTDAVQVAKAMRGRLPESTPFWPLGLPRWNDPWVCLGLATPDDSVLLLWNRDSSSPSVSIPAEMFDSLPTVRAETIFPRSLTSWEIVRNVESGAIDIHNPTGSASARLVRLTADGGPTQNQHSNL